MYPTEVDNKTLFCSLKTCNPTKLDTVILLSCSTTTCVLKFVRFESEAVQNLRINNIVTNIQLRENT